MVGSKIHFECEIEFVENISGLLTSIKSPQKFFRTVGRSADMNATRIARGGKPTSIMRHRRVARTLVLVCLCLYPLSVAVMKY